MQIVIRTCIFLFGIGVFLLTAWNSHNHLYGIEPNIGVWGFIGIPVSALSMSTAITKR